VLCESLIVEKAEIRQRVMWNGIETVHSALLPLNK